MSETKQIVGTLAGIEERPNDWYDIKVEVPGWQYPLKLSTKKEDIVDEARQFRGGGMAVWNYSESQGNENPHRPGTYYMNRYLNSVIEATAEDVATSTPPPTAGGKQDQPRYSEDDVKRFEAKERRDYRSRAWAQTLGAWNHTIKVDEDPDEVFLRLQPFQRKVYEDICGRFSYPEDDSDLPF